MVKWLRRATNEYPPHTRTEAANSELLKTYKALAPRLLTLNKEEVIPTVQCSKSSDTIIRVKVLGNVHLPNTWVK